MVDARIFDDESNFARAQLEIDRYDDGAERGDCKVGKNELRRVARENGNAISLSNADRIKCVASIIDSGAKIGVRKTAALINDGKITVATVDDVIQKHKKNLS